MYEMNICYGVDNNYAEQLTVSIASVLKNADKNDKFNFYILDGGLTDENKENIDSLKKIKNFSIQYIAVNPNDFVTCPLLKNINPEHSNYHVTLATYFRFKLCEYLKDVTKVLYLDCDVIVRTSLKELYETDLSGYSACVVKDADSEKEAERLNLKSYFNAGVMLVNLDYWYKNNIPTLLFDCAAESTAGILWQDQDIFNIVLADSVKEIDDSWNFQYFFRNDDSMCSLSDCKILHYSGKYKPWFTPFEHAVFDIYYDYLKFTPYSNREIIYRKSAFGKFLTRDISGQNIVVCEAVSGVDFQSVNDEITKSSSKIDALAESIEKCYRYAEEKINEYSSRDENRINNAVDSIYEEISKNYKYTEAQDLEYNTKISEILDSKFAEISAQTSKNSAFFEAYILESVSKLEYETSNKIKNIISALTEDFNNSTNDKIDKVYSEITNNYEFTKNIVEEHNKEINSSLEQKNNELQKLISEVSASVNNIVIPDIDMVMIDKLKNEYDAFCTKLREIPVSISDETDKKLDSVYVEIRKNAEYFKNRLNEALSLSAAELSQNSDKIRDELRNAVFEIQSKISSDFIKNETQTALKFSEIDDKISKNHSLLLSGIEQLKSELTSYTDNSLRSSETALSEKISGVLSQIDEVFVSVSKKIDGINEDINLFREVNDKNFSELQVLIDNVRLQNESEIKSLSEVIEEKQSETLNLLRDSEERLHCADIDLKNEFENKINSVVSEFSDNTCNLSEKIYSVAIDFSKRIDDFAKYIENKSIADLSQLEFKTDKKSSELKDSIMAEIKNNTENILSGQKKTEVEIYEFANNNLKELYETFNNANSGLKDNITYKLETIFTEIEELKQKSEKIESDLSSKAESSLKSEIINLINDMSGKMQESCNFKIAEIEKAYDDKLNEQRIKYEQKLVALENKIDVLIEKNNNSEPVKNVGFSAKIFKKLKRVK